MPSEWIKNLMNELHQQLTSQKSVDPELLPLLQQLDADIHQLLHPPEPASPQTTELPGRVEAAAASLAAQHPQAEAILRQLADALGKMGI